MMVCRGDECDGVRWVLGMVYRGDDWDVRRAHPHMTIPNVCVYMYICIYVYIPDTALVLLRVASCPPQEYMPRAPLVHSSVVGEGGHVRVLP